MKSMFLALSKRLSYVQIRVLLLVLYVLVISPMGLAWRLIKKDPLKKGWNKNKNSYMIKFKDSDINIQNLTKPY